ncbi:UvrD-helicase domain-containing protein [Ciceribacter thiooxidans]|uniref:UvrD-helicase domain-containing protein n=1 Tax=Ciceribacter thiooxidans TaxID=1969821 RepID=A0ABV7I483_9HYPH|nr:UvrD-helicase domain-containing protein [Ciceribacter thiooxidans]
MKAIVLTPKTLFRLNQFSISDEWFNHFGLPEHENNIKRVVVGNIVYFLERELESDDCPVIVINLGAEGVFSDAPSRAATLERIITTARSIYTDSVSIPTSWRKHHEGSFLSIQATPRNYGWRARLHFNIRPRGSKDLFAFSRLDDTVAFSNLDLHLDIYDAAKADLAQAVLTAHEPTPMESRAGITLSQRLPQGFIQGATLDQWYTSKLTVEQRQFVDKPHDGPVRLRGSAGTGKTLSLVIKFLRDAIAAESDHRPMKFGFLTHSFASVDLVNSIGESLDTTGLFYASGKNVKLEVRTLYDLAHKHLNFELDQLIPLSLDGREGRRLQSELIETVLRELANSNIAGAQFQDVSPDIKQRWSAAASGGDKRLIAEVMNEFASVLDAEGVRSGEEKGERYAKGTAPRPAWLMQLHTEADRRFVLEIHRRYRKHLGEMNTLSVDQMIGDFNSFLDSNRWDRIRSRDGYDVLFVDELHLFTSVERQILHKLIKRNVEEDGRPKRPAIFMAYDLKQSPRDTFATYGDGDQNLFSASTGLQGSELVKLERIFRYTPQIAEFLADLDATFPAIDIPGEWDAYSGKAELESGSVPDLTVFPDEVSLFSTVFNDAHKVARSIHGGGRRVAVLCAGDDQFDTYLIAASGQFPGKYLPITSREPSSELRHAGKRFIFSMPEYVAGLQFDTVFLIHVDASEATLDAGDGIRRRFISNIYLGSSRAEKTLRISACMSRGGKSDILDMALDRKSLIETAPPPGKKRRL